MKESLSRGSFFFSIFYRYTFLSGKIIDMELTERVQDMTKKFISIAFTSSTIFCRGLFHYDWEPVVIDRQVGISR